MCHTLATLTIGISETKRETKKLKLGKSCSFVLPSGGAFFRIKFQWFLKFPYISDIFKDIRLKIGMGIFLHVHNDIKTSIALVFFFWGGKLYWILTASYSFVQVI